MHSNRAIPPVASDTDTCPVDVEKMATWIADECRCHPRWFAPLSDCRVGQARPLIAVLVATYTVQLRSRSTAVISMVGRASPGTS
jgi:hypothetical protein